MMGMTRWARVGSQLGHLLLPALLVTPGIVGAAEPSHAATDRELSANEATTGTVKLALFVNDVEADAARGCTFQLLAGNEILPPRVIARNKLQYTASQSADSYVLKCDRQLFYDSTLYDLSKEQSTIAVLLFSRFDLLDQEPEVRFPIPFDDHYTTWVAYEEGRRELRKYWRSLPAPARKQASLLYGVVVVREQAWTNSMSIGIR